MKKVTHYKPNLCYELLIDSMFHYIGCHCRKKEYLKKSDILHSSGNYLRQQVIKKQITTQEYLSRVQLIGVWEFETPQEALDFESVKIQECLEQFGNLCVNKCPYGNQAGLTGYKHTTETKSRISSGNKGKKRSPEIRAQMSIERKGRPSCRKGVHLSDEEKSRVSDATKKAMNRPEVYEKLPKRPVIQYSMDGVFIKKWSSISKASKETGISHIWDCCRGERKSAGSFLWEYSWID